MEHRIGMEIRVLSKYMGRYLDDIHGIDCMLSGPQGLILIYLCENAVSYTHLTLPTTPYV